MTVGTDAKKQACPFKRHFRDYTITHVVGLAMISLVAHVSMNRLSIKNTKREKKLKREGCDGDILVFSLVSYYPNNSSKAPCSTSTFCFPTIFGILKKYRTEFR